MMGRAIRLMTWIIGGSACALVGSFPAGMARAAEVRLEHKGIGLLAEAALAPGKTWTDGAILLLHGTMAHRGMDTMAHLQKALLDQGRSSLSITLSLGISDRRGMADCEKPQTHRQQDAPAEIAAWVGYLKSQGATDVTLFGHSRGGNQVVRYALAGTDPAVKRVVLLAPAGWEEMSVAGYRNAPAGELQTRLADAERFMAAGRGNEMMRGVRLMNCPQTSVSASAFLSYYRDDGQMKTFDFLGGIRLPTLVIAGTSDTVTPDISGRMKGKTGGHIELAIIDGADHFFRDLIADEVADIVVKFASGG